MYLGALYLGARRTPEIIGPQQDQPSREQPRGVSGGRVFHRSSSPKTRRLDSALNWVFAFIVYGENVSFCECRAVTYNWFYSVKGE